MLRRTHLPDASRSRLFNIDYKRKYLHLACILLTTSYNYEREDRQGSYIAFSGSFHPKNSAKIHMVKGQDRDIYCRLRLYPMLFLEIRQHTIF